MALLDDVKSELAAIDNELPIAKKAQATAMIRFGNGLHSVDHHILVQVQLDSQDATRDKRHCAAPETMNVRWACPEPRTGG